MTTRYPKSLIVLATLVLAMACSQNEQSSGDDKQLGGQENSLPNPYDTPKTGSTSASPSSTPTPTTPATTPTGAGAASANALCKDELPGSYAACCYAKYEDAGYAACCNARINAANCITLAGLYGKQPKDNCYTSTNIQECCTFAVYKDYYSSGSGNPQYMSDECTSDNLKKYEEYKNTTGRKKAADDRKTCLQKLGVLGWDPVETGVKAALIPAVWIVGQPLLASLKDKHPCDPGTIQTDFNDLNNTIRSALGQSAPHGLPAPKATTAAVDALLGEVNSNTHVIGADLYDNYTKRLNGLREKIAYCMDDTGNCYTRHQRFAGDYVSNFGNGFVARFVQAAGAGLVTGALVGSGLWFHGQRACPEGFQQ